MSAPLSALLEKALTQLEDYPDGVDGDADCEYSLIPKQPVCLEHPVYKAVHALLRSIPDSVPDQSDAPNFPGAGGKLWYSILRISRQWYRVYNADSSGTGGCDLEAETAVQHLRGLAERFSDWLREHYKAELPPESTQPPAEIVIPDPAGWIQTLCDKLDSIQQRKLFKAIAKQDHSISWDSLPPDAFRDDPPSDDAIDKALKRLQQRLSELHEQFQLELEISPAERRVKLIRPRTN